jgi:pimeloyl-ACP methyl ester carboxylesterase
MIALFSVRKPARWSRAAMLLTLLAGGLGPSEAWGQKGNRKAPPEDKTLVTRTGIPLKITYFPSQAGEEAPVAVLLHGKSGNRLVWKNFATRLQQETNFAVITVDLSGHGESGSRSSKAASDSGKKSEAGSLKPFEYQAMVADDLETVKRFIFDEHQKQMLNMSKLAIVGADFSAAVAVAYADFDWQKKRYDDAPTFEQRTPRGEDVRGLILLSPEEHVPGLTVAQSAMRLKRLGMPVMIGVAKKDSLDKGAAKKLYEHLTPKKLPEGEKQYAYLIEYEGQLRGTDLLNQENQKVETNMLNFLEKHVSSFPVEWRDRRSRLERDDEDKPAKK